MIYSKLNAYDAYESGLKTRLEQRKECGDMPFSIYKLIEWWSIWHGNYFRRGVDGSRLR